MAVSGPTVQVKVLRSRLLELGLYSSLLTTATMLAWWFWQRQALGGSSPGGVTPESAASLPILTRLLLQKPIVLTFALAEFILGLALLLMIVPVGWWLKSGQIEHLEASPVTWLARSLSGASPHAEATLPAAPNAEATPAPVSDDPAQPAARPPVAGAAAPVQVGDASAPASPGQAPQPQPSSSTNQAQPAAPAQSGAQPTPAQPGVTPPASQQPQPAQPSQPAQQPETSPAQGQTGLLQSLEIPPEEESLESLTDVSDILASFVDEDLIDPMLAELSASLEDVEIATLAASARHLARELQAARIPRPVVEPGKLVGEKNTRPAR